MVPFERDTMYLDRPNISREISHILQDNRLVALAGTGGVGKSQIAIEYFYRFREQHPSGHVFWIHFSTLERAVSGWSQMARKIEIPSFDRPEADILHLVKDYVSDEAHGPWLLVLDNADDGDVFFKSQICTSKSSTTRVMSSCLPLSKGGITLLITRNRSVGEKMASRKATLSLHTDISRRSVITSFKITRNDWDEANASKLVTELDCIPLAVTQAAAFISQNSMPISDHLASLQADSEETMALLGEEIYDVRRDQDIQAPILRTWKLSFDLIEKQKPRAIEVLGVMSVLDRQGVPKNLLERSGESVVQFILAFGTLQSSLMIKPEKNGAAFGMHRLVQASIQAWLE